jgi:hypothetical protein
VEVKMRVIVEHEGGSPARSVQQLPEPTSKEGPATTWRLPAGHATAFSSGALVTMRDQVLSLDGAEVRPLALALLAAAERGGWS